MLFLIVNIPFHKGDIGMAHTEGGVSFLPLHSAFALRVEPLGGIAFNGPHKVRYGHIAGQITENMDMVLGAVDGQRMAFLIGYDAVYVGMEGIVQIPPMSLQTEDYMH